MKDEGLIKDTYELIIKELQTIVTGAYIIAFGIGMLFNYQKYSEFGINIFDYSDVFDFLIAPFSDFYILFFATVSILIFFILVKVDVFCKNKWPKFYSILNFGLNKKSWFKQQRTVLLVVVFFTYLYFSANFYGSFAKDKVVNQNDISVKLADNEIKSGKLIGKTNSIIFLLKDEKVYAIPISSLVKEIRIR